jgi:hypothetical protein
MKRMPQLGLGGRGVGLRVIPHRYIVEGEPAGDWLEANDNGRPTGTHGIARLRSLAAVVRSLTHFIDDSPGREDAQGLGKQLIEEMALLGCLLLEAAASMTREQGAFVEAPCVEAPCSEQ